MTDTPDFLESPETLIAAAMQVSARLIDELQDQARAEFTISRDEALIFASLMEGMGKTMMIAVGGGGGVQ